MANTLPQQTIRSLADELAGEIRQANDTVSDLTSGLVGPRPEADDSAKDPRSDLRSSLERSLARMRYLNGELCRINNDIGIGTASQGLRGNKLEREA